MVLIRSAQSSDLAALCSLRYNEHPAIHRDRIAAVNERTYYYLVAEREHMLLGFGILLIEKPVDWSNPLNSFPIIIDLFVAEPYRSQGVGSALIGRMGQLALHHGKKALYLSVESEHNPRALALYRRLGFEPLGEVPYHNVWRFTDSDGVEHAGEEWLLDMRKVLEPEVET